MAKATFITSGFLNKAIRVMSDNIKDDVDTYCLYNIKWNQFARFDWKGGISFAGSIQSKGKGSFNIDWLSSFVHADFDGVEQTAYQYTEAYVTEIIIPRFHSIFYEKMNRADMIIVPVVDNEPDFEYSVSFEQWVEQNG